MTDLRVGDIIEVIHGLISCGVYLKPGARGEVVELAGTDMEFVRCVLEETAELKVLRVDEVRHVSAVDRLSGLVDD